MCKKKVLSFITLIYLFTILLFSLFLTGCSNNKDDEYTYSFTLNFYKDEYDPEFNQYEKTISVNKETSNKIKVEGTVSDGIISVQLIGPDDILVKEYSIDDFIKETIETNNTYGDWKVVIKIDKDTEGSITVSN